MNKHQRSNEGLTALAHVDLFGSCTGDQLAALLPDTDLMTVAAGTVLDRSGTLIRQFVGIIDGYVEALDDDGCPTMLGPGDHIGGAELFGQYRHRATYTAVTASSLVVIFGPAFRSFAGSLPAVAARLINTTSRPRIDALTLAG